MKLVVLGSGSRGNAVAVTTEQDVLLVDAGFPLKVLHARAEAMGLDLTRLCGVVVTHEHGDHAEGAWGVARRARCPLYASAGTLRALGADAKRQPAVVLPSHVPHAIGAFVVTACPTTHDAAEPVALAVDGPGGERLGIAYDLGRPTAALRLLFRDATCLLMEANHDEILLRTGPYPASVRQRIAGSRGHLSNRAAAELLSELWHPGLGTIVLAHVSESCNRAELARGAVRAALREHGFAGVLEVASQDRPTGPFDVAVRAPAVLPLPD
ncbi:MAG TPA: MBL fold metallo-hydrolase [Gemmatimonadales bacterium]|jgi:phosphoribosyl 1,2-cyclic phosphodiesterase